MPIFTQTLYTIQEVTVSSYIKGIEFNTISFYQKDRRNSKSYVYRNGKINFIDPSTAFNFQIGSEYDKKIEFEIKQDQLNFLNRENNETHKTHGWHPAFEVLEFKLNNVTVGILFCDFFRKEFYSQNGGHLNYDPKVIQDLYILIKEEGFIITPYVFNNKPQPTYSQFQYPASYLFNSNFGCIETQLALNFTSTNDTMWRLEIETENEPTSEQVKRIKDLTSNRFEIKNKILDNLFQYYNSTAKIDFELPDLSSKESLLYFLREGSVIIPSSASAPITIYLGTWDEEHGATFYLDDNTMTLTEG